MREEAPWSKTEPPGAIEDYAIIGDTQTLALVGRNGSIDWLCLPRFDSGACFAALLGSASNGRWRVAPRAPASRVTRRYRPDTLVLETEFQTAEGAARVIDFMPIRGRAPDLIRVVEGLSGTVSLRSELVIRFDYGSIMPWVRRLDGRLHAIAGPDALVLDTPVATRGEDFTTVAEFQVRSGERVPLTLTWHQSSEPAPTSPDPFRALDETEQWWRRWVARCADRGRYRDQIVRSLITLKALTCSPSGAIVAAGTTSLPEELGGVRNWDYRYCWLRDSTFTLYALLHAGYVDEARSFRDWLSRAAAGDPSKLQIMYGIYGERRLDERELEWLPGYANSRPVRIGNAAAAQLQLDVYGELIDTFHQARQAGLSENQTAWSLQTALIEWLDSNWAQPDEGLWEVRGGRRHFTHSKVMCWVAFDRAIKAVERRGLPGPVERWRKLRDELHRDVCQRGYDARLRSFVQYYGGAELDAALLLMPAVGFLPPSDVRVRGTVAAVERELLRGGFVRRYTMSTDRVDGLPGTEGAFLACSFWLVDAYVQMGRFREARELFERLLSVANDVGLLAEEYDLDRRRLIGNFPQAFSHVALINSARNLTARSKPTEERSRA
jgi:GH15 family glucan-1,4-alpha-glucosidase